MTLVSSYQNLMDAQRCYVHPLTARSF